jgi:hypothetical protein
MYIIPTISTRAVYICSYGSPIDHSYRSDSMGSNWEAR